MKYLKLILIFIIGLYSREYLYSQNIANYYPLEVGNTWEYITIKPPNKVVVKVKEHGILTNTYLIEKTTIINGLPPWIHFEVITKRDFGILLIGYANSLFWEESFEYIIPPKIIMQFPLEINKEWIYISDLRGEEITYKIKRFCNIEVKAGKFSNVCNIEYLTKYWDPKNVKKDIDTLFPVNQYYAPNVGLILETIGSNSDSFSKPYLELVNYHIH